MRIQNDKRNLTRKNIKPIKHHVTFDIIIKRSLDDAGSRDIRMSRVPNVRKLFRLRIKVTLLIFDFSMVTVPQILLFRGLFKKHIGVESMFSNFFS